MTELLDAFGLIAVLLRGATLTFQSLVIGGAVFLALIGRPAAGESDVERACGPWLTVSAVLLAITEALYLFVNATILMGTTGMPLRDVAGANFFIAGSAASVSALAVALLSRSRAYVSSIAPTTVIVTASVMMSHAAGRLQHGLALGVLTAAHQVGVGAWIGGLPYLLIALARSKERNVAQRISKRFSRLAMTSVGLVSIAGLALSVVYVRSVDAIYGTAYGVMLAGKMLLFGGLLLLGGLNYLLVRRLAAGTPAPLLRLRRFGEAEIGIGFTAILMAASLTSQPPAVDLVSGRVTLGEIAERMRPHPPRLTSPSLSELSPASPLSSADIGKTGYVQLESYTPGSVPQKPDTPADIAWSEYNHHWSGLFVLLIGFGAILSRSGRFPWACHWPLLFFGLAAFLFLRSDSENWPLGPRGFWESFVVSEVLQHRIFVVMIILFALFEWRVQTGRLASRAAAVVFPLMCAIGGALLVVHSHSLGNVKNELLVEMTHLPIGLLAVAAGWSRWLEIRLPDDTSRISGRVWPVCLVLIGTILLLYRET